MALTSMVLPATPFRLGTPTDHCGVVRCHLGHKTFLSAARYIPTQPIQTLPMFTRVDDPLRVPRAMTRLTRLLIYKPLFLYYIPNRRENRLRNFKNRANLSATASSDSRNASTTVSATLVQMLPEVG